MTAVSKSAVTLRIAGDNLDPLEITQLLGAEPHLQHRKGDPRPLGKAGRVYAPYRSGMWLRKTSDRSPGDLNGQIAELLGPLSQDLSVWESLADRFRADIFIGLFLADTNEGLTLLPSTMQLAAARRLSLGFDIYGHIGAAANPPVPESD